MHIERMFTSYYFHVRVHCKFVKKSKEGIIYYYTICNIGSSSSTPYRILKEALEPAGQLFKLLWFSCKKKNKQQPRDPQETTHKKSESCFFFFCFFFLYSLAYSIWFTSAASSCLCTWHAGGCCCLILGEGKYQFSVLFLSTSHRVLLGHRRRRSHRRR